MLESHPIRDIGRVFVGRQQEMGELKAALNDALSGQGQLAMLAGEPGIGKTRTAQELATEAETRGAKVLWGWCYEEGSLSLPYLPFVEALRSYVHSLEMGDLRQELGSGAPDVARIVSEVRDILPVELRPPGDPEEDRHRLLQAVSDFLGSAAQHQHQRLVLEDLHDADRGTLDLLTHVAHNLAGSRLLIVGTYRDVEVDRVHPLSGALANLRRISGFSRVLLRGLTLDEVQGMVEASAGQKIPLGLAEAVERQTEGNPLFVHEVLRYLVEELGISGFADQRSRLAIGRPLMYLGKGDDALHDATFPYSKALCLAHLGRHEEVSALLEELVLARPGIGSFEDESDTGQDIVLLEAATLVAHREAVELLMRRFAATKMRTTGFRYTSCIARHLGDATVLLGRLDEARGYYQTAVEVFREMPFRPEEALTHLHLAELLLDHYPEERTQALEHLDTALAAFHEMNMLPSLERAVALKERAEAGPVKAPTYPDGLTQREVEVLRLIAGGKTNLEIADALVIAEGTARRHVGNIYEKIGVANRADAAIYASRQEDSNGPGN